MRDTHHRHTHHISVYAVVCWFLMLVYSVPLAHGNLIRKLIGSNCVTYGGGRVPVFQTCFGCRTEEAMGCVMQMRENVSGNVNAQCTFAEVSETPPSACCPLYGAKTLFGTRIKTTSAYPDTFACLKTLSCEKSDVYSSLLTECKTVCSTEDVCLGTTSSAPIVHHVMPLLCTIIASASLLLVR